MKKLIAIGASFALVASFGAGSSLATPGNGHAKGGGNSTPKAKQIAARKCVSQKHAMGNKAFKALYGKRAMRTCQRANTGQAAGDIANASQACTAEEADVNFAATHGGSTFAQFYGANENDKNAFGKCVSSKVDAKLAEDQGKTETAAQACRVQRADPSFAAQHGGQTFAQVYGTNHNDKNAFGKCVVTTTA
jgi:hypothetical protein